MFVAAIIIPILFIVFYFIVKRNNIIYDKKWQEVGDIYEQVVISGTLDQYFLEKKKFYHHRYIWSIQLYIKENKNIIQVLFEKPVLSDTPPVRLKTNDKIKCYGQWSDKTFLANRIIHE